MEGRTPSVNDRLNVFRQSRGGGAARLMGRGSLNHRSNISDAGKGRSGNAGENPDSITGSFDPMGDDYRNENINSYDSGPGADLPISDQVNNSMRSSEKTRLYVKNIDRTINKTGLQNIFSKCGKVVDCFVNPMKPEYDTNTGLVVFEKIQDARRAIEELHNKKPHNLIVKFALDNPTKVAHKVKTDEDRATYNEERTSRNEERSRFNCDTRNSDNFRTNNGQARVVNGATTNARWDQNDDGRRSKSYGNQSNDTPNNRRNYTSGKFNAPDDSPEVEINNKLFGPESTTYEGNKRATLGHTVYIPRSNPHNSSNPSVNGVSKDCNGEYLEGRILSCPYKYGSCKKCGGTATNVCSWCKDFYCSQNCFQGDSSSHKSCRRRDIKFESDGRVMFIDVPEEKLVHNKSGESSLIARNEIDQKSSRPNHNRPTNNRNENFAKNVYVVKEKSPSPVPIKTEPERVTVKKKKTEKIPLPLPENTFTPVTIVYMDDAAYYGMETRRTAELQELTCTLQECAAKEQTLSSPKVGDMCASIFDGAWYRCRISELKGSTAVVRYIDFGNDEKVEVSSLKVLQSDLAAVPDLAIAIKINKQSKILLAEGNEIKIKPIRMLKDNQLIAQIEDDPAPLPELEPSDTEVEETTIDEVSATKSAGLKSEPIIARPAPPKGPNDEIDGKEAAAKESVYEKCVIVYKEAPSTFWVTKCVEDIYKVSSEIGALCKKAVPLNSLKVDRVYGHLYDGIWCRAQIMSLSPLDVFFVDFGNADKLEANAELFELPLYLENLNRLAFKIELEEGYPASYLQKAEDDDIEFTVIRELNDETSLVRVIDSLKKDIAIAKEPPSAKRSTPNPSIVEDKNLLPVKRKKNRTLYASKKCSSVTVEISHVLGPDCLSGTLISDAPDYVSNGEISARLAKFKFVKEDVSLGADVIARVGSSFHRGYVMKKEGDKFQVALVDYGRIVGVTEVAPLPQELKNVFENSVRVVFDKPMAEDNYINLIGKRISFTRIDSGADFMKAHSEQYGDVVIQPWECMVEEMELEAFELTSGSEVVITAASSPVSVYLQSLDTMEKLDLLIQDLASHCMKEKPMTRKPLCNEMVACKFEIDQKYYRARIEGKSKDKYRVVFVDYGNVENDIPLDHFKRLSDDFKCFPCCAVKVGLKRVPGPRFNSVAMKIINDFSIHETIFIASFEGKELGFVELKNKKTGLSLNEKLSEAMKPSWLDNPDASLMVNPYMVYDLKFEPWPRGQPLTIGVVSVKSYNEVTCILAEETPAKVFVMSDSFTQRMTSYAETVSKYVPRKQEMCLAIFEGQWYRAVCLDHISNDFLVFFVDYGNTCTVSHDELRKMPPEFMEPPAYVKHCDLINFVDDGSITKENKELLKSKMESELMTNCYVIDEFADKAVLWTDYFNDTLEKLGLPLKEQPPI